MLDRAMTGSLVVAAVSQGVLIVSGVLVARSLGPEDRGYLALLPVVPAVCALIGLAGLPPALTYYIARDRTGAGRMVSSLLRVGVLQIAAIVILQAAAFVYLFADDPSGVKVAALVAVFLGPGIVLWTYGLAVLQGQHRFDAFNLLRVIPTSSYVVVVLALFLLGRADLVPVTLAYVGTTFLGGVLTLAVATLRLPKRPPDPAGPRIWEMAKFGFKSLLATVSPVDALRLDQIAVGLFLNPVALGYYVVAQSLTGLPRLVATSMGMIVYPRIASQPDAAAARRSVWKYFAFGAAICAGIAGALAVAAGVLIRFFFGTEFSSAVLTSRLLLLAVVFITARRILTDGANGLGHPGLGTIAEVASWVILLPSLALLLPPYGDEGVAVALVIAWGGSLVIMISLVASIGRKKPVRERSVRGSTPPT